MNDRIDLALACGASGVHLGQEDLPLKDAQKIAGKKLIFGVSCQTLAHVRKAEQQGADYIGFGSVFKTLTKPERETMNLKLLGQVMKYARIPIFVIGGITADNIIHLQKRGVQRIAVCRAICAASDVKQMTQKFKRNL